MSEQALPVDQAPAVPTPTEDRSSAPTPPPAPTTTAPTRPRRAVLLVLLRRFAGFALSVAFLAGGVALGYQAFAGSQPPPAVVGDPATQGVATPGVVEELVQAIARDDADAIRAALSPQIFDIYAGELQRWSFGTVTEVETLATYQDGPRAATALVLHGRTSDRNPVAVHLIVLTENGQIVSLR